MDYEILMPQFSDTMERGKVIRWLKKEGDFVEKGEAIAEIEAEKAVMELQSFKRGVIVKILVREGEEVPVGKPIALMELGERIKEPPKVEEVEKREEKRVEEPPKVKVEVQKKGGASSRLCLSLCKAVGKGKGYRPARATKGREASLPSPRQGHRRVFERKVLYAKGP